MEEKEVQTENTAEKQTETKINLSLSERVVNVLCAFAAMFLLIVTRIVLNFTASAVFAGIMCIFIYLLALGGVAFNFFRSKKPTVEFWLSVGAFVLTMFVM